jgi:FMN phosphatase YigB (HAD superfamily)
MAGMSDSFTQRPWPLPATFRSPLNVVVVPLLSLFEPQGARHLIGRSAGGSAADCAAVASVSYVTVRAVISDIGGVLEVNTPTGWPQRWASRLGLGMAELEVLLGPAVQGGGTGEVTLPEIERRIAAVLRLGDAELAEFMDDVWAEYLGTLNTRMVSYFAALRPRYATGILSNSFVGAREREQAAYGFADLCDVVVYSHEEGMEKPEPRCYLVTARRLGVPPCEAVFLDDTEGCVAGARAVGMQAVLFTSTEQAIADLESCLGEPAVSPPSAR